MLQHPVLHAPGVAGWETSSLLNVVVGSTVLLGAAWAGTALMRRSSAARRHLVWCVALGAVLLLPGLSVVLPAWRVLPERFSTAAGGNEIMGELGVVYSLPPLEIDAGDAAGAAAVEAPVAERTRWRLEPGMWLLILWAAGAMLVLMPAVLGRWLLRGVERSCVPASEAEWDLLLRQARRDLGLTQAVTLLLSGNRAMPMTWGIRRPRVLLPAESRGWPTDRRRVVLLHELGHVKRRDCLTHLLGQVARAVYWFHPLAWVAGWRIQVERERACDDLVLQLGTQQADYAQELVEVTAGLDRAPYAMAGIAMAKPSRLEQRVREILDSRRNRRAATRRHVLVTVALVGLVAVPVAIMRGGVPVQDETKRADEKVAAAPAVPPPAEPDMPSYDLCSPQAIECAQNWQQLHLTILNYASKHEWRLPPDLGATLPYAQHYDPQTRTFRDASPAEAAKYYLCPLDRARVAVPAAPTPEWINRNTSYAYLGGADVNVDALTTEQFENAVMVHEKNSGAHPEMGGNAMAFILGGGMHPQTAERIAWSRQALDATHGAPFATEGQPALARMWASVQAAPKASECARNQSEIFMGIAYYMNFSRGYYPPTLGDTLPYILKYRKRRDPVTGQDVAITPQQAARIYLCSQDQDIEIPENVTPEWINEHTSFVYLGDETLTENADPLAAVMYERLDRGHGDTVNITFADCHVTAFPKDQAQAIIDRSIVMLEDDRARTAQRAAAKADSGGGSGAAPGATASAPSRRPVDPNVARLGGLRRLLQVLVEQTQDRRGRLPGDLVDVFQFAMRNRGPKAPPPLREARVAAQLLLSPRAQKGLKVPEEPSKGWLKENASYVYLGDDRLTVDLMQAAIPAAQWPEVVVLHEKPVEGDPQVAVATLDLVCRLVEAKKASEMIERSKGALATARTATASVASQPTNQAQHPAQRWRGKSTGGARQTAVAAKGQAEGETK